MNKGCFNCRLPVRQCVRVSTKYTHVGKKPVSRKILPLYTKKTFSVLQKCAGPMFCTLNDPCALPIRKFRGKSFSLELQNLLCESVLDQVHSSPGLSSLE